MLNRVFQPLFLTSLLLSNMAIAQNCLEPIDITLPDGATIKSEGMIQSHQAVNNYIKNAETFLQCLDAEEKNSPQPLTLEQKKVQVIRYNQVVDKMHQVAQGFNEQLHIYKAENTRK